LRIFCKFIIEAHSQSFSLPRLSGGTSGKSQATAAASLARVHVAMPKRADGKARPPNLPPSIAAIRATGRVATNEDAPLPPAVTLGERMRDWDGEGEPPGFNDLSWRDRWMLKESEWRYDVIPEILDGKNIADYIDPDILQKLDELEAEEEQRLESQARLDAEADAIEAAMALSPEEERLLKKIRDKKDQLQLANRARASTPAPRTAAGGEARVSTGLERRSRSVLRDHLVDMGIDPEQAAASASAAVNAAPRGRAMSRSRSRSVSVAGDGAGGERRGRKRSRSASASGGGSMMRTGSTSRSASRASLSKPREAVSVTPGEGYKNVPQKIEAAKKRKLMLRSFTHEGKQTEKDRFIGTKMPKHLYSGKRGTYYCVYSG
jgi:nucleolar GTP-binding protein